MSITGLTNRFFSAQDRIRTYTEMFLRHLPPAIGLPRRMVGMMPLEDTVTSYPQNRRGPSSPTSRYLNLLNN